MFINDGCMTIATSSWQWNSRYPWMVRNVVYPENHAVDVPLCRGPEGHVRYKKADDIRSREDDTASNVYGNHILQHEVLPSCQIRQSSIKDDGSFMGQAVTAVKE